MSSYELSLIGLERYMNANNDSLFTDIAIPEGIHKTVLINNILMRSGDFELLYSEPTYLKSMIYIWSNTWYRTFDRWYKALNINYDPLENYNRTEEFTDTHSGTYDRKGNNTNKSVGSGNSEDLRTDDIHGTSDSTNTGKVSAFNASGFENKEQDIIDSDTSQTGTVKNEGKSSFDNTDTSNNSEDGRDAYTNTHRAHIYGNIGTMTSQKMLQDELSVQEFNLYNQIADIFIKEFCLLVY